MERVLAKLTEKYQGWVLDSFTTNPTVPPGAQGSVIITILSPDMGGESPTLRKKIIIANVLTGDITEGV